MVRLRENRQLLRCVSEAVVVTVKQLCPVGLQYAPQGRLLGRTAVQAAAQVQRAAPVYSLWIGCGWQHGVLWLIATFRALVGLIIIICKIHHRVLSCLNRMVLRTLSINYE